MGRGDRTHTEAGRERALNAQLANGGQVAGIRVGCGRVRTASQKGSQRAGGTGQRLAWLCLDTGLDTVGRL